MFWFSGHKTCEILAPWPGIEPTPLALESKVWTTRPSWKIPSLQLCVSTSSSLQLQTVFTAYCARHGVTDPLQLGGLQPCLELQMPVEWVGREEQKLYLLIEEWEWESAVKTPSPQREESGGFLRSKGKICLWGKGWWFPGIANMCAAPLVPLDTALIVPNKIYIPSLDWDLSVVMKLRQLSDPSWFLQCRCCSCS